MYSLLVTVLAALAGVASGSICSIPTIFNSTKGDANSFTFSNVTVDQGRGLVFEYPLQGGYHLVYSVNDSRIYTVDDDGSCTHTEGSFYIPNFEIPDDQPELRKINLDGDDITFYQLQHDEARRHTIAVDENCNLKFITFFTNEESVSTYLLYNTKAADEAPEFDAKLCTVGA